MTSYRSVSAKRVTIDVALGSCVCARDSHGRVEYGAVKECVLFRAEPEEPEDLRGGQRGYVTVSASPNTHIHHRQH